MEDLGTAPCYPCQINGVECTREQPACLNCLECGLPCDYYSVGNVLSNYVHYNRETLTDDHYHGEHPSKRRANTSGGAGAGVAGGTGGAVGASRRGERVRRGERSQGAVSRRQVGENSANKGQLRGPGGELQGAGSNHGPVLGPGPGPGPGHGLDMSLTLLLLHLLTGSFYPYGTDVGSFYGPRLDLKIFTPGGGPPGPENRNGLYPQGYRESSIQEKGGDGLPYTGQDGQPPVFGQGKGREDAVHSHATYTDQAGYTNYNNQAGYTHPGYTIQNYTLESTENLGQFQGVDLHQYGDFGDVGTSGQAPGNQQWLALGGHNWGPPNWGAPTWGPQPSTLPSLGTTNLDAQTSGQSSAQTEGLGLPNAIPLKKTFSRLPPSTKQAAQAGAAAKLHSMHNMEFHIVLSIDFVAWNLELHLIWHATLALAAHALRANGCKYFGLIHDLAEIRALRHVLHKKAINYYDRAISLLRDIISTNDFNISLILVASSLLNKAATYDSVRSDVPVTFSKGMLSVINDLYRKNDVLKLSEDLAWSLDFLEYASNFIYIPTYDPTFLVEVREKLDEFGEIMKSYFEIYPEDKKRMMLTYCYRLFQEYFDFVMGVIEDYKPKGSTGSSDQPENEPTSASVDEASSNLSKNIPPQILYQLMRRWFIIIPPFAQVPASIKHPIEKNLAYMYLSMNMVLMALFPSVMYMFMLSFVGGVPFYIENPVHLLDYDGLEQRLDAKLRHRMLKIHVHSIRVGAFFRQRFNTLGMFFGDNQRREPLVHPEVVRTMINEVPIHRFDLSVLQLMNFNHIPGSISLRCDAAIKRNKITAASVFHYNLSHFEYFQSNPEYNTSTADQDNKVVLSSSTVQDPILQFHLRNTNNFEPALMSQNKRELRRAMLKHEAPDYLIWFEWEIAQETMKKLEDAYTSFFQNYRDLPEPSSLTDLNVESGFFNMDYNPIVLVRSIDPLTIFERRSRKDPQSLTSRVQVLLTHEVRRHAINQEFSSTTEDSAEHEEVEDVDEFYNDLLPELFI